MNKIAFITGGSRGIGFGVALALGNAGFDLAVNGMRNEGDVAGALEELRKLGVNVAYFQGNVAVREDRQAMLDKILAHFGAVNVLVNNAGIAPRERADILHAKEEIWEEVMEINLKGPYFLTQLFANYFVEKKLENPLFEASIINISSISAFVASVNRGEYCISKAGIAMATKLWATRLGEYDIPVYEIQPGIIKTDMTAGVVEKYDKLFQEGITLQRRWGLPDDVGKVAAMLAQGNMPYATGQAIKVDGGLHIQRL
ncbi:MAG: 3-ketoacyl-ACP reductase [Saprospiraceae bacterium]|nr:3-ketoacyl-ACP reductase [Saprospiraceae bacterium]MDP5049614.1 3-ketoacyl-ACP reductase [Saprospiraceae bacterium]